MRTLRITTLFCFLSVAPLAGQTVLSGFVRADSTGRPLSGVEVLIEGTDRHTVTDAAGRFVLGGLPRGSRVALFRSVGWRPVRLRVRLVEGDTIWAEATMGPQGVQLPPITVTAEPKVPRGVGLEAFEERRRMGFGKFIDSTELRRHEQLHLDDMLRTIPGILTTPPPMCGGRGNTDCVSDRMWRVAVSGRNSRMTGRCFVQVVVDGVAVSRGGDLRWEDTFDLNTLRLDQLQAVEVYRSASEIPPEFNNTNAACGVLVLWTRR